MVAGEVELVAEFALHLLAQPDVRHAPDEVGAELRRGLLGADHFRARFFFFLGERTQRKQKEKGLFSHSQNVEAPRVIVQLMMIVMVVMVVIVVP